MNIFSQIYYGELGHGGMQIALCTRMDMCEYFILKRNIGIKSAFIIVMHVLIKYEL